MRGLDDFGAHGTDDFQGFTSSISVDLATSDMFKSFEAPVTPSCTPLVPTCAATSQQEMKSGVPRRLQTLDEWLAQIPDYSFVLSPSLHRPIC